MKKGKKKLLAGIAAIVILIAVLSQTLLKGGKPVEISAVARESVEDQYTEEGRISFGKEYRVIAQVSGPVKQILVGENSQVEKGQILFTVDSAGYEYEKALNQSILAGLQAQLEQSRISQVMTSSPQEYLNTVKQEMEAGKADYLSAKTVYEGSQALYAAGAISMTEQERSEAAYQKALTGWQQAKGRYEESSRMLKGLKEEGIDQKTINSRFYNSEVNQLTAQIKGKKTTITQLEDQIAHCQVKAECDGIVTSLPVHGMSVIQSGETAAVLNSREGAGAEADVLTSIAPYIKEGSPVEVVLQLRGQDETYTGTVSRIYDYASKSLSSLGLDEYRVHVKVALDDGAAVTGRDGYGVNLKFLLYNKENCLTVPSSSLFKTNGRFYAYEVEGDRAVKVPLQVEYQTGTKTVVTGGLKEGDRVITQVDSGNIYEGAKIRGV